MKNAIPPVEQVELVQHEFDRTRPELSQEAEHEQRLIGMIDKRGRRLPAMNMEIGIVVLGMLLVGIYFLFVHPLFR